MRTFCHIQSKENSLDRAGEPRYFELEREALAGDFVCFKLAKLWALITARYFFMGEEIEDKFIVLDALLTEPPLTFAHQRLDYPARSASSWAWRSRSRLLVKCNRIAARAASES